MPGKDDGVKTSRSVNTCNLNCDSYAAEEEVITSGGLLRRHFLFTIEMEEKKESIAEEEADTRSDDIKNLYHVHIVGDCCRESIFSEQIKSKKRDIFSYCRELDYVCMSFAKLNSNFNFILN